MEPTTLEPRHDRFADLDREARLAIWKLVENDHSGLVRGYDEGTGALVLAMPRDPDAFVELTTALILAGLKPVTEPTLFPLCSDNPPEHIRHLSGYWVFQNWQPRHEGEEV